MTEIKLARRVGAFLITYISNSSFSQKKILVLVYEDGVHFKVVICFT